MTELIDINSWYDAMNGDINNPLADPDIQERTEKGEITVVDKDGKKFTPVKNADNKWELEPN